MSAVKSRYRAGGFRRGLVARLAEFSWRDLLLIGLPVLGAMVAVAWVAIAFFRPAPPDRIRLLSGPDGSSYRTQAERYQKIIQGYGVKVEVIPSKLRRLPHIERPKWRPAKTTIAVKVTAQLLPGRDESAMRAVSSGEPLQKGYWIRFTASSSVGTPFTTNDYRLKWRITNTDQAAYDAQQLRGDFYDSDPSNPMSRAEILHYRGVHFVESFLVRRSDSRLATAPRRPPARPGRSRPP